MAKQPDRLKITLSPHAREVYAAVAREMRLPLATFIRQTLEQGVPIYEAVLEALHDTSPQRKVELVAHLQRSLHEELSGLVGES